MAEITGNCRMKEEGLSEVIGFVLIIGLLVAVASLYLTYGVPAQGRENEILHMNSVKDQFVTYKVSLDSLFNNNKVGTTVSNSFTLGTGGSYTTGTFSFLPVMSPVSSNGVIAINERTKQPETLSLVSQSLILNATVHDAVDLPARVENRPEHIYVNFSDIRNEDLAPTRDFGAQVMGTGWIAAVNLTPRNSYYMAYSVSPPVSSCPSGQVLGPAGGGQVYCLLSTPASAYNWSDISITVMKNNMTSVQDLTVYRNISSGITYSVDLMDEAYGVSQSLRYPDNLTISVYDPNIVDPHITGTGNVTYSYSEMTYTLPSIALGALEYRAQNSYWIPQTYYYQMGGIFLAQSDGNITHKLPPEISFRYINDTDVLKRIVTVNINALVFDPDNRGVVGGNSPVQIKTTLTGITPLPYAHGSANTKWIRIAVNTTDEQAKVMWKNYFNYTAMSAGVPNTIVGNTTTESYILINGYDPTDSFNDINVIAANGLYSTTVRGVGGIVT